MLVEMAVADAYAIAWEFTDKQKAENDLTAFHQHPTYLELKPGMYTDDTQRSIANAKVIKGVFGGEESKYSPWHYARSYIQTYNNDPREGYSRGYQAFLKSVETPEDFLLKIQRTKDSNGSLMGVAPLGFLPSVEQVKLAAMMQALTTHNTETVPHAQIVALAAHYFLHVADNSRDHLFDWLMLQNPFTRSGDGEEFHFDALSYERNQHLKTGIKAKSISAYMVYAVSTFDTLGEIILDAVARGGDTDSAAAVSVAVASCCKEITNDIPEALTQAMDQANPGYGVDYMTTLEADLCLIHKIG